MVQISKKDAKKIAEAIKYEGFQEEWKRVFKWFWSLTFLIAFLYLLNVLIAFHWISDIWKLVFVPHIDDPNFKVH